MRKITRLAAYAFRGGDRFTMGNTSVTQNPSEMYLHGNLIAQRVNGKLRVTLAGWGTPTTRERVNGLLEHMGVNARFFQRDHGQCVSLPDGSVREISASDWIEFE